jgi:hypothetical protein
MVKATIRLQVELDPTQYPDTLSLEVVLQDLLKKAVFPTLNVELVPLSLEVRKARS